MELDSEWLSRFLRNTEHLGDPPPTGGAKLAIERCRLRALLCARREQLEVDFEVPLKPAFDGVPRLVESLKRRLDHAIIDARVFGRGQILLEDEADDVEFIPGGTPRETP